MENKNLQSVLSEMNEYAKELHSRINHYECRIEYYAYKKEELFKEDPDFMHKNTISMHNRLSAQQNIFIHKKGLANNFLTKLAKWQEKLENS